MPTEEGPLIYKKGEGLAKLARWVREAQKLAEDEPDAPAPSNATGKADVSTVKSHALAGQPNKYVADDTSCIVACHQHCIVSVHGTLQGMPLLEVAKDCAVWLICDLW